MSRIDILQYPIKGKAYIQGMKLIYEAPNSSDLPITESESESDSDGGSMEFISLFVFLFLLMERDVASSNNMQLNLLQLVSFRHFIRENKNFLPMIFK
ncbi:hypothetical protein AB1F87_002195 [Vibrio mimicus]